MTPGLNATPTSTELGSSDQQVGPAPILQLFDNDVVIRRRTESSDDKFTGFKDMSPKAQEVRTALLSLLPPQHDIGAILKCSTMWWSVWENNFPEVCDECRRSLRTGDSHCEAPMAPAEVAKMLVLLSIIVSQLPVEFNYASLRFPFDPHGFSVRCISEVERLIIHDDYFAATLPGIECQAILSKYYLNEGRPRKAWLVGRRAIEFGQLAGMHLSTSKAPRSGDILFARRLQIWCQLVSHDRFISLILGLPYSVSDGSYFPQAEMCLQSPKSVTDNFVLRLGIMAGKIVDRNQNSEQPSSSLTLSLEHDLEDMVKKTPAEWWETSSACRSGTDDGIHERNMIQFTYYMLRVLLYLPFIMKSSTDPKFEHYHAAAVEAAQNGLERYKTLRTATKPFLCKVCDFFAFMMTMLLAIHQLGCSMEPGGSTQEQENHHWGLVVEVATILRQVGTESNGAVAAESANVLDEICSCRGYQTSQGHALDQTCKITVPYFGTITVGPGKKLSDNYNADMFRFQGKPCTASKDPTQLCTPPISNPDASSTSQDTRTSDWATTQASDPGESWSQINMPTMPTVDLEVNPFPGFLDDMGEGMWPNLDMDLGLDQGWNVDWFGGPDLS